MSHRPLGLLYLAFAAGQLLLVGMLGVWALPCLWIAATFCIAGLAYVLGKPTWMGKRLDGTRTALMTALMVPYAPLAIAAAWYRRHPGEPAWNEVAPNLFVGRRVRAAELPAGTTAVVDLTSEFSEPGDVRTGRLYRCLPTMDGCASEPQAFATLAREIAAWPHRTYIHCAVGHGRSASLAAAVMVLRGEASDAHEAEVRMQRARPGIELKPSQKRLVDALRRS